MTHPGPIDSGTCTPVHSSVRTFRYTDTDSTNEQALQSVTEGAAHDGDVHVALHQTKGRGRQGRPWVSAAGQGLYLSYVHIPKPPSPRPEAVTVAAGLAVLDAVREAGAAGAQLKWPNDLVCDGAKLAGVLVESRGLRPEAPHFVVGVGLNVLQREFPEELEAGRQVTSLVRLGVETSCRRMEELVLDRLPRRLAQARRDPLALFEEFLVTANLRGTEVELVTGEGAWVGTCAGIGSEFEVELALEKGPARRFPLAHVQSLTVLP